MYAQHSINRARVYIGCVMLSMHKPNKTHKTNNKNKKKKKLHFYIGKNRLGKLYLGTHMSLFYAYKVY